MEYQEQLKMNMYNTMKIGEVDGKHVDTNSY